MVEWLIKRAREGKGPGAIIGRSVADVRDTLIEVGESSIMRVCPKDFMPTYEPSKRRLQFPNGVIFTTFSGDEWPQLRGPQHQSVVVDELAKFENPEETYNQMSLGLRIGDAKCCIATTPTATPILQKLHKRWLEGDKKIRITTGSTFDNKANLDPTFIHEMETAFRGTHLERQEIFGELVLSSDNALFQRDTIDKYRVEDHPELIKVVVAIDPSVSNNRNSDECGIVVGGIDENNIGYLLGDFSFKAHPSEWVKKAIEVYESFDADIIVYEKNQGGLLIEEAFQAQRSVLPLKGVHGFKSKSARMEPIALLAQQGKIKHVGRFDKLEDELVSYENKGRSPNRFDAYAYLFLELMLSKKKHVTSKEFLL